ncbi:MAG: threonine/homoserine exporter RhtA [Gemmatimonas sp.]
MTVQTKPTANLASVAILFVAMASVQGGAALAKGMFATVGPLGTVALRVGIAAVLMCAAFRPWRVKRSAESWRMVGIYGAVLGLMNALFYTALQTIPLGIAVALEFTGPLAVALLASRRRIDFLWIALAIGGLLALLPLDQASRSLDPVGIAFALGAGVCWALYIIFGQKAGAEHGVETAAMGMAIAAVIALPLGIINAGSALLNPNIIPVALAVAVLSSALPYTLEMYSLRRLPTKTFGTLMSVEPALGALSGLLLLGEQLTLRQWLGIFAIIITSIGTTMGATQKDSSNDGVDDDRNEQMPLLNQVTAEHAVV